MPFLDKLVGRGKDDSFIFTSSGVEAFNHVLFSTYLDVSRKTGKNHFITLEKGIETRLQELGCVHEIPPENGKVTLQAISETISPRTALISLPFANPLTGVIHSDLFAISELCKERNILFHVDVTTILGKGEFSWHDCGADFLSFNGEELGAPVGTGGLFVRRGLHFSPLIVGKRKISNHLLTLLEQAAEQALSEKDFFSIEKGRQKNHFENACKGKISNTHVLFENEERLPHISALVFENVYNEALLFHLQRKGILANLGPTPFSLSFFQHDEKVIEALIEKVAHIRKHGLLE